jgi:uncharacterized protein involved in tolerance to divalent cations
MIQLVIASGSKEQLEEIAEYLLSNHLIISVEFHPDIRRMEFENGKIKNKTIHFITGKTKSLLFSDIDIRLRNLYNEKTPEIFSHPIVDMEWKLLDKLKSKTAKI